MPQICPATKSTSKAAGEGARPTRPVLLELRRGIMNSSRILVSGASGPIGAALVPSLKAGERRHPPGAEGSGGPDQIVWDPARPCRRSLVSGFDAVIHLAGESIVGRWTAAKKRRILESRVQGTGHLAEAAAQSVAAPACIHFGLRGRLTTAIAAMRFCAKTARRVRALPPKYAGSGKPPHNPRPGRESALRKCGLEW